MHLSEHGGVPLFVSAIAVTLPDLSADTICFGLAIMASKRLFEDRAALWFGTAWYSCSRASHSYR